MCPLLDKRLRASLSVTFLSSTLFARVPFGTSEVDTHNVRPQSRVFKPHVLLLSPSTPEALNFCRVGRTLLLTSQDLSVFRGAVSAGCTARLRSSHVARRLLTKDIRLYLCFSLSPGLLCKKEIMTVTASPFLAWENALRYGCPSHSPYFHHPSRPGVVHALASCAESIE